MWGMANLPPMLAMLTMAASPCERDRGGAGGEARHGWCGARRRSWCAMARSIGGDGLVFDGADFDDAGVVDEDVDAAEVADGVVDEHGGLGGVGEIGGDEEEVFGVTGWR